MNILVIAHLTDEKLESKLRPLSESDKIDNIYLVRRDPLPLTKVINYNPPNRIRHHPLLSEFSRIPLLFYLIFFKKFHVVMGIYLTPHGILAAITAKLTRKLLIQYLPGTDVPAALKSPIRFRFISMADVVITRGKSSKQQLQKRGISKESIYHIPNTLNFENVPLKDGTAEQDYDVIFVGRFVKAKRIDILLRALHKLKYSLPDIQAALIGDGVLRQQMQALARESRLDRNVSFPGHQKNVYAWLLRAKVFIMTSEYEGLPMAMIEAMGCGLPCIVSDVSNIPTVAIHDYNALLVPVGDVEGFANQLFRLLTDHKLYERLAGNALKIRDEKQYEYSLENTINIWNVILEQLTGTTPKKDMT